MPSLSRGFRGRRPAVEPGRLPPGQHLTSDWPVMTYGPTPGPDLATWDLRVDGMIDEPLTWTWEALQALEQETITVDVHCVTHWSKLDMTWTGVSIDTLLDGVVTEAEHATVWCDGGYTTNLPLEDLMGGKAWVAHSADGEPLSAEHGGPARLLVPHLYFWKSAKWIRGITLTAVEDLGFWEVNGYHAYGDPWREQRYDGD